MRRFIIYQATLMLAHRPRSSSFSKTPPACGQMPPSAVLPPQQLEDRAQLAAALRRHVDPHLRGSLGGREEGLALGLLGGRLVDPLAKALVELRHLVSLQAILARPWP